MDYEFIARLNKSLGEYYQYKISILINAKDLGDFREIQGAIKAIEHFKQLVSDSINPKKNEENKIEQSQYNI